MQTTPVANAPVTVPFVCPICVGPNAVNLIALSRAGGVDCAACGKWLSSSDVMRAIHSPRPAPTAQRRERAPPPKRAPMTWPPTPESRRAADAAYQQVAERN